MTPLSKVICSLLALLFCATVAVAQQQDGAKPDRWRGLVLDESTAEDAIKVLGQPKKDGPGQSVRFRQA
jgi:hypothetical protein